MVSMMAQRMGISARAYLYAKTPAEIALDVEAWVSSWAFPASVIAGGKNGKKGSSRPGRDGAAVLDRYPWMRKLNNPPGRRRGHMVVTDLDEIARMTPERANAALLGSGLAKVQKQRTESGKVVAVAADVSPVLSRRIASGWAHNRFRGTS